MNISTPAALTSIDTSSSLPHPSSWDTSIPKDAASPTGRAEIGPSLWRSILDIYAKEILECASDQFLDLAVVLRLETINAKDLVDLLAKTGRQRHIEADIIEDEAGECLAYKARDTQLRLDAKSASMLSGQKIDQGRRASTPSPQRSPVQASRERKRRKVDERESIGGNDPPRTTAHPTRSGPTPLEKLGSNNVQRRKEGVRMREQRLRSVTERGKSGPAPGTKVGTVLQVEAPTARASNLLRRPHIQRGILPVLPSDTNQAKGISAQRINFVVISDTEPE